MEKKTQNRTLLIVDDELNILSALERLFRRQGYKILKASSGKEGIEILNDNSVGVIISDQRMPEMTGVEFLSQVKETHPDTIRIVLSGYTELKSVTDAINQGAIYKFLTKPWDDELLLKNVDVAFEQYELKIENTRLNEELKLANLMLEKANQNLHKDVEIKTEEAEISTHILSISQEVLENMPAGIICIGSDGLIAITNKLTELWLKNDSQMLIGNTAEGVLPEELYALYKSCADTNLEKNEGVKLENGITLNVRCSILGKTSESKGIILVLTQGS